MKTKDSPHALVTGASGFIGLQLVRSLTARGYEVTCLVCSTSRRDELAPLGVRFVVGDVLDPDSLRPLGEVDVVFHLAAMLKAPWRTAFQTVNATGVENVARACLGGERPPVLVVVSSLAAAGTRSSEGGRVETEPPAPVSRYGRSKLAGELAAARMADRLPVSIVRPPMVFGGGDRSALSLFRMASRGWALAPTPHPMSLIHVADLAALLVLVGERGERLPARPDPQPADLHGQGIYHAAAEEQPTLAELGGLIGDAIGRERVRALPIPSAITLAAAGLGEAWGRIRDRPTLLNLDKAREARAGSWTCSAAKARETLGFAPAPLEDRLAETAAAYQETGWL